MDRDHDGFDVEEDLGLDEILDEELPPPPPADVPWGRGPRSDGETWLSRSPFWVIPLLVSIVFGVERLAMLAIVPGNKELPIVIFGALFIVTFAVVLAAGGLAIQRHRR